MLGCWFLVVVLVCRCSCSLAHALQLVALSAGTSVGIRREGTNAEQKGTAHLAADETERRAEESRAPFFLVCFSLYPLFLDLTGPARTNACMQLAAHGRKRDGWRDAAFLPGSIWYKSCLLKNEREC